MIYRTQSGTFQIEEDFFSKCAQGIAKNMHEVFPIMKLLQTKPQGKSMIIKYYGLFHTVIKVRDEKEDERFILYKNVNDPSSNIITIPSHGIKVQDTISR